LTEDSEEDSEQVFDRRLEDIVLEYRQVEQEVFKLDSVQSQAYCIECARLSAQLRDVGGMVMSENEDSEEEEEDKDEENYLEEKLVRKVPLGQVDGGVREGKCLGCEEVEALDKYYDEHGEKCLACEQVADKCTCEAC
jgi:hypothetical protein